MKDYKRILTSFIEVVVFLLASFGGFLKKIAPPTEAGASYPVGIMSFLVLITLMIVSIMGRHWPPKIASRRWTIAGIVLVLLAVPASFVYPYALSHFTYPRNADLQSRHINASDRYLTPDARQFKLAHPNSTSEELDRNLPDGGVWTEAGVERSDTWLLAAYLSLVLSLSGAIFCLMEAIMHRAENR